MDCCRVLDFPQFPLSPIEGKGSLIPEDPRKFKIGDADPIIKQHAMQWLICIESYRVHRANLLYGWIYAYGDAESCIYHRGCNVLIAFRGSKATKDIYDDMKISFGQVYPRAAQATTYVQEFARLNPDVKIFLTGHSLGGAIARDVGKALGGLNTVTFNAASPPSYPVESGLDEIDYHIVFDIVSAWQQPNTIRIDKGFRPTSTWGLQIPLVAYYDLFKGMIPAHKLSNFSKHVPGVTVPASEENNLMQMWFRSMSVKVRTYLLVVLFGVSGSFMLILPNVV